MKRGKDRGKYFMVSLFLQQLYREMLTIADEHGGKLPNRVMLFADEIGTIPKVESMEMMLSADVPAMDQYGTDHPELRPAGKKIWKRRL